MSISDSMYKKLYTPWPAKCRELLSVCVCVCVFVSALFCALLNVLFYVLRSLTFCSGPLVLSDTVYLVCSVPSAIFTQFPV